MSLLGQGMSVPKGQLAAQRNDLCGPPRACGEGVGEFAVGGRRDREPVRVGQEPRTGLLTGIRVFGEDESYSIHTILARRSP